MDNNVHQVTTTEEIKREAVLAGLRAGRASKAIAECNKISLSFVYKMQRTSEVSERPENVDNKSGKPALRFYNVRTLEFVARVGPQ